MRDGNSVQGNSETSGGITPAEFGVSMKRWRARRGLSQLDLALRLGASQRHLSFLETGRARPSVAMVEALCDELAIPVSARDALLAAAGHAPRHRERKLDAPELAMIARVFEHHLEALEPYPALLLDRRYALVKANASALLLFGALGVGTVPEGAEAPSLLATLFDPNGLRRHLANWEEVARHTLRRMRADALIAGIDDASEREIAALAEQCGIAPGWDDDMLADDDPPVMILDIRMEPHAMRLFTTVTTVSMPFDQTAQELRLETFFPADPESDAVLRSLAAGSENIVNS